MIALDRPQPKRRRALLPGPADFERAPQVRNEHVQEIAVIVREDSARAGSREAQVVREALPHGEEGQHAVFDVERLQVLSIGPRAVKAVVGQSHSTVRCLVGSAVENCSARIVVQQLPITSYRDHVAIVQRQPDVAQRTAVEIELAGHSLVGPKAAAADDRKSPHMLNRPRQKRSEPPHGYQNNLDAISCFDEHCRVGSRGTSSMYTVRDFSPFIYNSLGTVEDALAELNSKGKNAILEELGLAILKNNLEKRIGIRLLHNHNTVDESELMLESYEDSTDSLVTRPVSSAEIPTTAKANTWLLKDEAAYPIELSDSSAMDFASCSTEHRDLFEDFARVLKHYDVAHILGPCVISKDFYGRAGAELHRLVETIDLSRRANSVRYAKPDQYPANRLVETTWVARRDTELTKCVTICLAGSCEVMVLCVIDESPDHPPQHGQRREHTKGNHQPAHIEK